MWQCKSKRRNIELAILSASYPNSDNKDFFIRKPVFPRHRVTLVSYETNPVSQNHVGDSLLNTWW